MRDRQYWQNGRTADAYRDAIAQLWKLAYPGKYVEGSFSRNVEPATTPQVIRAAADDLLGRSPAEPPIERTRGPGIHPDQPPGKASTLPTNVLTTVPVETDTESTRAPGIGHNSGAQGGAEPDVIRVAALLEDPEDRATMRDSMLNRLADSKMSEAEKQRIRAQIDEAIPGDAEQPVQVANAQALRYLLGLLFGGAAVEGYRLGQNQDDAGDEIRMTPAEPFPGLEGFTPEEPVGETQETYPADPPDLDDQESYPADPPEGARGIILITPDGSEHLIDGSPPPSEDQSDILPQGTILQMEGDDGTTVKVNMGGASQKAVSGLGNSIGRITDKAAQNAAKQLLDGTGFESWNGRAGVFVFAHPDKTSNGHADFIGAILDAGGNVSKIHTKGGMSYGDPVVKEYTFDDGTTITWRANSKDSRYTNDIQIRRPDGKVERYIKIRYGEKRN